PLLSHFPPPQSAHSVLPGYSRHLWAAHDFLDHLQYPYPLFVYSRNTERPNPLPETFSLPLNQIHYPTLLQAELQQSQETHLSDHYEKAVHHIRNEHHYLPNYPDNTPQPPSYPPHNAPTHTPARPPPIQ